MHMNTPRSILIYLLVATAIPLDTSTMNVVMHFQLGRLSVGAKTSPMDDSIQSADKSAI